MGELQDISRGAIAALDARLVNHFGRDSVYLTQLPSRPSALRRSTQQPELRAR
jgi:hypothetical protein